MFEEWIERLKRLAVRHQIVFSQLGSAHEPVYDSLSSSGCKIVDMDEFLASDVEGAVGTLIIVGVEKAIGERGDVLGRMREKVAAAAPNGLNVVLVSRAPRVAYPDVPGSSLLIDAKFVAGPVFEPTSLGPEEPTWNVLPSCRMNNVPFVDEMEACLTDVGVEVCAALDRAIFQLMLQHDEVLTVLSGPELEALQGSGLTRIVNGRATWTVPRSFVELSDALCSAFSRVVAPPATLGIAYEHAWSLEHKIRFSVRARALEVWGAKWRKQVLPNALAAAAVDKALAAGYSGVRSIAELRDPLEWLSLGELLEVRQRAEIGDLGMPKVLWAKLSQEVLPIRNSIAHMHLVSREHVLTLKKWATALDRHLK